MKSWYHGTVDYFDDFEKTEDIGFHFGTKGAALDRIKKKGGVPKVTVAKVAQEKLGGISKDNQVFAQGLKDKYGKDARLKRAREQGFDTSNTYYHGTARRGYVESTDIAAFDKSKAGDSWSQDERGFYFTNYLDFADYYSSSDRDYYNKGEGEGCVYPVYLKCEKPLIIDKAWAKKENMEAVGVKEDSVTFWDVYHDYLLEVFDEGDYDSIILRDETREQIIETIVVMEPTQIRSVNSLFDNRFKGMPELHEMDNSRARKILDVESLAELVYPRINNATRDYETLRSQIGSLSSLEKNELRRDYSSRGLSERYLENLTKGDLKGGYSIRIDDVETHFTHDNAVAKALKTKIKEGYMRKVNLSYESALEMPDLGSWSPHIIANELNLSESESSSLYSAEDETAKYDLLKKFIKERGYDAITYKNAVEGKGSKSIIVFNASQIIYSTKEAAVEEEMAL